MGKTGFGLEFPPEKTARALAHELHISPKHAVEICSELKHKRLESAKTLLEEVAALRRAIPMRRYNHDVPHQPGTGPGRYPKRAATELLKLLKDAESNAEYRGLDTERLVVAHMAARRGRVIRGSTPRAYGRFSAKNVETVTVEVILRETGEEGAA
jgi:large subunit ribosomal protein L22